MTAKVIFLCRAIAAVLMAWGGLSPSFAAPPMNTMAQRMQACVVCHGQEGRATNEGYFPRIAGKPAGYLFNQLVNFREGRRKNAAMAYLLDQMSDTYLQEIADYFSGLELAYPPPPPTTEAGPALAAALARGEQLVRQGDAARGVPSCASCHGAAMTGVMPATPGLVGLPRDYLLSQFGAWRNGQRHAAKPDCMKEVALRLSAEDVGAMATWLSLQPVPANAKAVSEAPQASLMKCGSTP
ncbi:c-type cytochrome [Ottowia thiooxydans]|uniref:Cytochrome c553 n=1 Tax=Ottowia thiooxydans TaxID=219182 RepID=A0ABV2QH94_9BURK